MGRPAGSKNKPKEVVDTVVEVKTEITTNEEKKEEPAQAVQVKPKLEPLGPGQQYFEDRLPEICRELRTARRVFPYLAM